MLGNFWAPTSLMLTSKRSMPKQTSETNIGRMAMIYLLAYKDLVYLEFSVLLLSDIQG